jgi:hypothetical protein
LIVNNAVSSFQDHGTSVESATATAVASAAVFVLAAAGVWHAPAERHAGSVIGSTRNYTVCAVAVGLTIADIAVGGNCVQFVSSLYTQSVVNRLKMILTLPRLRTSGQSGKNDGGN